MSPELILASYSCARRDHIVRLTRARPFRVSSARLTSAGSDSLRMPTLATFAVGTRSVILSLMKLITKSSSFAGDLLLLDRQNLADAVGGIDHEFVGLEALTLGQNLLRLFDPRGRGRRLGGGLVGCDGLVHN